MDECDVVVPRDKIAEFIRYTHELQDKLKIRIKVLVMQEMEIYTYIF